MLYFGTRLSDNLSRREPEGYLICLNVPVARIGVQEYLPSELGLPGPDDRMIPVHRRAEEVFSPACVASFEGMPVTDDHPADPEGVNADNIRYLQKGHAHNIRRGAPPEEDLLLADLIITDPRLIREILDGKREISCGYNYVLAEEGGQYFQRDIRGNHVAVVDSGRAGPRVAIRDRKRSLASPFGFHDSFGQGPRNERSIAMKKNQWYAKLMARMARDGDLESLAEMINEVTEGAENPAAKVPADEAPAQEENREVPCPSTDCGPGILSALNRIIGLLTGGQAGQAAAAQGENRETAPAADCGPEILSALNRIIGLLTGGQAGLTAAQGENRETAPATDCGPEILSALNRIIDLLTGGQAGAAAAAQGDEEPADDPADVLAEVPAVSPAEGAAQEVSPEGAAAEVAQAVAQALGLDPDDGADEDPVEQLVAEILEGETLAPAAPGEETVQEEILSQVLESSAGEDEEEDPEDSRRAADALRAALAAFRPQMARMTPRERQRFNADVARRMRKLTGKAGRDRNPYAAIRGAAPARSRDARELGRRIMASRNVNLK